MRINIPYPHGHLFDQPIAWGIWNTRMCGPMRCKYQNYFGDCKLPFPMIAYPIDAMCVEDKYNDGEKNLKETVASSYPDDYNDKQE